MPGKGRGDDISDDLRLRILLDYCLVSNPKFEIPNRTHATIAGKRGVSVTAARTIWRRFLVQERESDKVIAVSSRRVGLRNAESWPYTPEVLERLEFVNDVLCGEGNREVFWRRYVAEFHPNNDGPAEKTVERWLAKAGARVRMVSTKPLVTEKQKLQRIQWVYDKVERGRDGHLTFEKDVHTIWVDEKWFYLTPVVARKRTVGNSQPQPKAVKSKRYIQKVMFLVAVGNPVGDWDGKIGIYPFVKQVQAQRNSKNRDKGQLVTEGQAVTLDVYAKVLHQVIKDAKEKLPEGTKINIQQDGARPHGMPFGKDMVRSMLNKYRTWTEVKDFCTLETQPPQSPDLNLCDLSFFWSLHKESLSYDGRHDNLVGLMSAMKEAFEGYPRAKLTTQCAYMYSIYRKILANGGETNYKLPNDGTRKRGRKEGNFADMSCSEELMNIAAEHISRLRKYQRSDIEEHFDE